jgi:hypothetical protein
MKKCEEKKAEISEEWGEGREKEREYREAMEMRKSKRQVRKRSEKEGCEEQGIAKRTEVTWP